MSDIPFSPSLAADTSPQQRADTWLTWVATVDHKRIGILYLVTTLVFFLMGGIEALLMRIQLARPGNTSYVRTPTTRSSPCTAPP